MTNAEFEKLIFANCEHPVLLALCKTPSSPPRGYVCETCEKEFSQKEYREGFAKMFFRSKLKVVVVK